MNTLMIAYNNGVIGTEYHSTSESAINSAKELVPKVDSTNIVGLRIDFTDGTCAVYNRIQQSDCLNQSLVL